MPGERLTNSSLAPRYGRIAALNESAGHSPCTSSHLATLHLGWFATVHPEPFSLVVVSPSNHLVAKAAPLLQLTQFLTGSIRVRLSRSRPKIPSA